jgi:putative membrane protein
MLGHGLGLGMGFMSVFGVVIVALLVAIVALLWRDGGAEPHDVNARRILAERLARGEISDDEYRSRLDLLRHAHPRR